MEIQTRQISTIIPYEDNPRKNDKAVDAVCESIKQFGFRQPIVVDTAGVIVCGHTRWKAAQKLGLVEVPVHVAEDLTEDQIRAYRIADNKTAELATWDIDLLSTELGELQDSGLDFTLLGFSEIELGYLVDSDGKDADEVPEPPDVAVTQRGDLYIIGDHRLLCGDSAMAADVDRLLDGRPIHLVNTDPPYNVKVEPASESANTGGQQPSWRSMRGQALAGVPGVRKPKRQPSTAKSRRLESDFLSDDDFDKMLHAWFGNIASVLSPGRGFYIWGTGPNIGNYPPILKEYDLYFSQPIVWVKEHPTINRLDFMKNQELCFYGWRKGAAHVFFGPNNVTDVWSVKKVNPNAMIHLTEKPVELATRAIQYSSCKGENVLDLFGGSGSTMIAAEQAGRHAFLMELDPLYCDVIVQRWEKFTNRKAERDT